jgi:hypothetical protein
MPSFLLVVWDAQEGENPEAEMPNFEAEQIGLGVWAVPATKESAFRGRWQDGAEPAGLTAVLKISGLQALRQEAGGHENVIRTAFSNVPPFTFNGGG